MVGFKDGDQVQLRPEGRGYKGIFDHGVVYTVGGPHHCGDTVRYTGLVLPNGMFDQWYTKDFEYANGPW